jgi:hypothetical protein
MKTNASQRKKKVGLCVTCTAPEITVTPNGVEIPPGFSRKKSLELFYSVNKQTEWNLWALADLVLHVQQQRFAGAMSTIAAKLGKSVNYLLSLAALARCYPHHQRRITVSFSHYKIVLANSPFLPNPKSNKWRLFSSDWLKKTLKNKWSCTELREAMAGSRKKAPLNPLCGLDLQTKVASKFAKSIEPTLLRLGKPEAEQEDFRELLRSDLLKIASHLAPTSLPQSEPEKASSGATHQRLKSALNEYLNVGIKSATQFGVVARKHGVKARALSAYRLETAAKMRAAGSTYSEIFSKLGVKQERLKKFMEGAKSGLSAP